MSSFTAARSAATSRVSRTRRSSSTIRKSPTALVLPDGVLFSGTNAVGTITNTDLAHASGNTFQTPELRRLFRVDADQFHARISRFDPDDRPVDRGVRIDAVRRSFRDLALAARRLRQSHDQQLDPELHKRQPRRCAHRRRPDAQRGNDRRRRQPADRPDRPADRERWRFGQRQQHDTGQSAQCAELSRHDAIPDRDHVRCGRSGIVHRFRHHRHAGLALQLQHHSRPQRRPLPARHAESADAAADACHAGRHQLPSRLHGARGPQRDHERCRRIRPRARDRRRPRFRRRPTSASSRPDNGRMSTTTASAFRTVPSGSDRNSPPTTFPPRSVWTSTPPGILEWTSATGSISACSAATRRPTSRTARSAGSRASEARRTRAAWPVSTACSGGTATTCWSPGTTFIGDTHIDNGVLDSTGSYDTIGYAGTASIGHIFALSDRTNFDLRGGILGVTFSGDDYTDSQGNAYGRSRLSFGALKFEPGIYGMLQARKRHGPQPLCAGRTAAALRLREQGEHKRDRFQFRRFRLFRGSLRGLQSQAFPDEHVQCRNPWKGVVRQPDAGRKGGVQGQLLKRPARRSRWPWLGYRRRMQGKRSRRCRASTSRCPAPSTAFRERAGALLPTAASPPAPARPLISSRMSRISSGQTSSGGALRVGPRVIEASCVTDLSAPAGPEDTVEQEEDVGSGLSFRRHGVGTLFSNFRAIFVIGGPDVPFAGESDVLARRKPSNTRLPCLFLGWLEELQPRAGGDRARRDRRYGQVLPMPARGALRRPRAVRCAQAATIAESVELTVRPAVRRPT